MTHVGPYTGRYCCIGYSSQYSSSTAVKRTLYRLSWQIHLRYHTACLVARYRKYSGDKTQGNAVSSVLFFRTWDIKSNKIIYLLSSSEVFTLADNISEPASRAARLLTRNANSCPRTYVKLKTLRLNVKWTSRSVCDNKKRIIIVSCIIVTLRLLFNLLFSAM